MARINKDEIKDALSELIDFRVQMRKMIARRLNHFNHEEPDTLVYATKAMLEAKFEPLELAEVVGTSRSTIGRWAASQTIPRSLPYRKWVVGELAKHLENSTAGSAHESSDEPLLSAPRHRANGDKPAHMQP